MSSIKSQARILSLVFLNAALIALLASGRASASTEAALDVASVYFDCANVSEIPQAECEALVALHSNTDGENWGASGGWLIIDTPCDWVGVSCDAGHVQSISLVNYGLEGSIPPDVEDLTYLQELHLGSYFKTSGRNLFGDLPPELGSLTNLRTLDMSYSGVAGSIPPELGNLANLEELRLNFTGLSGSIPTELGNLANLRRLDLSNNRLTGNLPSELGNLTNLQTLDLGYDSSVLPPELHRNQLSGRLPQSLTNLNLISFDFSSNNLCEPPDAAFQAWLASIPYLRRSGLTCGTLYLPLVVSGM